MFNITYDEFVKDLKTISEAQKKDPMEKYSIEISGGLKNVGALRVLEVIDEDSTFEIRAQFVKELLMGNNVQIYKNNEKIINIGVTPGLEWWAVDELNKEPYAFKFW